MKLISILVILFAAAQAFSQNFKEKELKTEIDEVTVFLSGAQIFESGTVIIPPGKTLLRIRDLSPYIDEKSIQVKAAGDFTVLSVNHKFNFLNELKRDQKVDSLKKLVETIGSYLSYENARLLVLNEKQALLDKNRDLRNQNVSATIAQLKLALEFYEAETSKMRDEEIKINKRIELKKKDQISLEKQVKELSGQHSLPSGEIEIRVSADKQVTTKMKVTYLVAHAGWYPKYDIRISNIKNPLELTYKAEVFQNTGVDWKNVKLKFSNGDPNQSGVAPELKTWNLSYARYTTFENTSYGLTISNAVRVVKGTVTSADDGSSLPGVNVVVKGSTVGTVTDVNGNYNLTLPNDGSHLVFSFIGMETKELPISGEAMSVSLMEDAKQLSEVVVSAYGVQGDGYLQGKVAGVQVRGMNSIRRSSYSQPILTSVIENQTTVEIEVATPYSVKSNGDKLQVELKTHEVEALYQYYAIPKLDRDAFLVARIINWDQYNLLEGEANLYFEDSFVGRSVLNAKSLQDTLTISLGRDKNIVIGREKIQQFSKKKTIGTNAVESRGFKIVARNKKSLPINLTIFDQIPVSVIDDITVAPIELTKGKLDGKTGKVIWNLTIEAQQQKDIMLQYEVKYPRREKVILE